MDNFERYFLHEKKILLENISYETVKLEEKAEKVRGELEEKAARAREEIKDKIHGV